ncbi:MAG: YjbQ family protein [Terriglobales bacterium]
MKTRTAYLTFNTRTKRDYINITPKVEAEVSQSGVREGMVLVSAMHITAGVWVNDAESGLLENIDAWLEHLAPFRADYHHHRTGESNADAHLKSLLVHHEVISRGSRRFAPWAKSTRRAAKFGMGERPSERPRGKMQAWPQRGAASGWGQGPPTRREHKRGARRSRAGARANIVPITAGRCDFGPWQQIYYAEFDGQRKKRVVIKVMGE